MMPSGGGEAMFLKGGKGPGAPGRSGATFSYIGSEVTVTGDIATQSELHLDGKVLGVTIARAGRVETYVLPGEVIRPLLADLRDGRLPPPAPTQTSAPAGGDRPTPAATPRPAGGSDTDKVGP